VSDVLRGFVKQKLAECINPNETKGRIYKLTPEGEIIKKELLKTRLEFEPNHLFEFVTKFSNNWRIFFYDKGN
jgi:hypothetical protein